MQLNVYFFSTMELSVIIILLTHAFNQIIYTIDIYMDEVINAYLYVEIKWHTCAGHVTIADL